MKEVNPILDDEGDVVEWRTGPFAFRKEDIMSIHPLYMVDGISNKLCYLNHVPRGEVLVYGYYKDLIKEFDFNKPEDKRIIINGFNRRNNDSGQR